MEIQKAITDHYHFIRGTICKVSAKYGSRLSDADIDDVVQNTAEVLLRSLPTYRYTTDAKLRTWMGYCAAHRTVDYLRRHNSLGINTKSVACLLDCIEARDFDDPNPGIILSYDGQSPVEVAESRERLARLRTAAQALTEADAELFQLVATGEFDAHRYAAQHGVTANAAFARRSRLRAKLKDVA